MLVWMLECECDVRTTEPISKIFLKFNIELLSYMDLIFFYFLYQFNTNKAAGGN